MSKMVFVRKAKLTTPAKSITNLEEWVQAQATPPGAEPTTYRDFLRCLAVSPLNYRPTDIQCGWINNGNTPIPPYTLGGELAWGT